MQTITKEQDQYGKRHLERSQLIGDTCVYCTGILAKAALPEEARIKAMRAIAEKIPQAIERLA